MRMSTRAKLAEVEAGYRTARLAAHRCGLLTCQEDGECAFPTRCVALPSDLSDDERVSEADIAAGASARCRNCGSRDLFADIADGGYRSCCPERDMRLSDDRIYGLDEAVWRREGSEQGWKPPARRPWWKRLWVIRHLSALWMSWRVHTYAGQWASVGVGIGGPNPYDLWVVEGAFHGYW